MEMLRHIGGGKLSGASTQRRPDESVVVKLLTEDEPSDL